MSKKVSKSDTFFTLTHVYFYITSETKTFYLWASDEKRIPFKYHFLTWHQFFDKASVSIWG